MPGHAPSLEPGAAFPNIFLLWPAPVGVYLLFEHVSNAGLTHYNEGLNDVGLRVGYRF